MGAWALLVALAACSCGDKRPTVAAAAPPPASSVTAVTFSGAAPISPERALTRFALGINEGLAVPARLREGMDAERLRDRLEEDATFVRGLGATLVRAHTFNFPRVSCSALAANPAARDDMDAWVRALGPELEGVGMVSPWPGNQTGTYTRTYRPADMAAFEACVSGLVERYDGDGVADMPGLARPVRFWEVDNEPDLKNSNVSRSADVEYDPKTFCTPAEYAAVLVAGARAIRAADPAAKVLALGLYRPHADQGQAYARAVLAEPGALASFDILSLHTYHDDDGERLAAGLRAVGAMAPGKPIWVTETSVSTDGGEEQQARRVAALVARAAEGGAEALFWHTLADPPARPGPRAEKGGHMTTHSLLQGVDRAAPVDKPAALVFRNLAKKLESDDLRGAAADGAGATRLRSGAVLLYRGERAAPAGGLDLRTGAPVPAGALAHAPAWIDPG